jgi:hypothetical protein
MSHFGGSMFPDAESTSLFVPGEDGPDERDASVRALRPRSSRRGSWGSEVSGWSAQVPQTGTPSQERSLSTSNIVRSDEATAENGRSDQKSLESESLTEEDALTDTAPPDATPRDVDDSRYDTSSDTSRDLPGAPGDSLVDPDISTRACYRSASLDTVGRSTIDKELSAAMSSVKMTDEKSITS